jgi:hypothetical protein
MSTEFKSFDEMTPFDLALERKQTWEIRKSTSAWWIYRNGAAFMPCNTEAKAMFILETYGIKVYAVDRSQREATAQDFAEMRRDKGRLMGGKGPSVLRRVYRFFGGDAA